MDINPFVKVPRNQPAFMDIMVCYKYYSSRKDVPFRIINIKIHFSEESQ